MSGLTDGELNDLVKLGDMIGDGLADEPDGKWIRKEYRQIVNRLHRGDPEFRKLRNESIDEQMRESLKDFKCTKCGGEVKQIRSGSKVAKCVSCPAKFKARRKKKCY